MKIALVHPKSTYTGTDADNQREKRFYDKFNSKLDTLEVQRSCINPGLLVLSGLASEFFDEIKFLDEDIEPIDFNEYFDVVAVTGMTRQANQAYAVAKEFRKRDVFVVAGGIHATNCPEEVKQYFDAVFIGEVENTWYQFMNDFKENKVQPFYKDSGYVMDLDKTPIPRYDLIDMNKYKTIPLQIGRGCPHNCSFCTATRTYGPKFRHKSLERIFEELDIIKRIKSNPSIFITDENLQFHTPFIKKLVKKLKNYSIRWMGFTDVRIAYNDTVLSELTASGCRRLSIGFESIEPGSLKIIDNFKYKYSASYEDAIHRIQKAGIGLFGNFILGFDNDDQGSFQKLVDFIKKTNLYGALVFVLTPFPGCDLYDQYEKEGRILSKNWGRYSFRNVVFQPKNLSVQELENGYEYVMDQIATDDVIKQKLLYFKQITTERVKAKFNSPAARPVN